MLRPGLLSAVVAISLGFFAEGVYAQGNGAGGILIDAEGVLQPQQIVPGLTGKGRSAKKDSQPGEVCVSLRRLSEVLSHSKPDEIPADVYVLGGLTRIDQIVVDAESRDVLLIGPGEAQAAGNGPTFVGESTARPLMRTGDFLTMLNAARGGRFLVRCSIDPEPARLKEYNDRIRATAARVTFNNAAAWYQDLARILGRQIVTVEGLPGDSRISNVLAAADYSMKRIALGLEPSGVKEIRGQLLYAAGDAGATMKRWWFAPLYDDLAVNPERTVFQLSGQRVKLLAQQELILDDGRRIDADRNRPSTEAFARQFTEHFEELTAVRPIFADLKNQFDLAIVAALLLQEKLLDRMEIAFEVSPEVHERLSPGCRTPRFVESGANIRRVNRGTIVGVVGGVDISPRSVIGRERSGARDPSSARREAPAELSETQFSWRVQAPSQPGER